MITQVDADNYYKFDAMIKTRMTGSLCMPKEGAELDKKLASALLTPGFYAFAAEEEGIFAGYICLIYIPKLGKYNGTGHLFVDELWVMPEYRRRGLARALMDRAEELARAVGAGGLRLYVNTENPGAQALYSGCGYGIDCSALFMEKTLN